MYVILRSFKFMFALIPYFCLWVSVVWHSCSMWVIVSGVVFQILCSCVSFVRSVLRRVIIIPSFLLLKFGVCWLKVLNTLCNWMLLVVYCSIHFLLLFCNGLFGRRRGWSNVFIFVKIMKIAAVCFWRVGFMPRISTFFVYIFRNC